MGKMSDSEKAEMYRRQLGGVNAALNRERGKTRRLQSKLDSVDAKLVGAANRMRGAARYDADGQELVVPMNLVLDELANITGAD